MLIQNSVESGTSRAGASRCGDCPIFEKRRGEFCVTPEENDWLTSEEAAAFLKVSPAVLRNLTSNGQVPFYKFGRRNRYRKSELVTLLSSYPRGVHHGN
jgi:excisionase family DNA binding protein